MPPRGSKIVHVGVASTPTTPDKVTLQIVSDIHLAMSRKTYQIPKIGDYLLIAGDIETYFTGFFSLKKFLLYHARLFKKVIWTIGNHETMVFGLKTIDGVVSECRKIADKTGTIFLYNDSYAVVPGLRIIGSPLFSYIPKKAGGSNKPIEDAMWSYTKLLHVRGSGVSHIVSCDEINEVHEICKAGIIQELKEARRRGEEAVVMTHFSPLAPSSSREQRDSIFQNWSHYGDYNTDRDMQSVLDAGKGIIKMWIYGHDHCSNTFTYRYDDGTSFEVVSNQLGSSKYPSCGFKPTFTCMVPVSGSQRVVDS